MLSPREVTKLAVDALEEKSARNVTVLKTEDLTVIANYFVICTATSTTHIRALADEVEHVLEGKGEMVRRKEGERAGGWVLLDFGCTVIHIFSEESRAFYNLERLWSDAEVVTL
ncbi:MAG: ribosome silencing factor [Oscillospiraceae bacterium]|nr:ribosome silencing factor [Oscillospiraceae bacterium]